MKKKGKKKFLQGRLLGYCLIFSKCESQYCKLYCDTRLDRHGLGDRPGRARGAQGRARGAQGRARGAQGRARGAQGCAWSATIRPARPRYRPRHSQGKPRHGRQCTRVAWLMDCVAIHSFVS